MDPGMESSSTALLDRVEEERPWQLKASNFRAPGQERPHSPQNSPTAYLTDCLKKFGGASGVEEYYQQQDEMLEGFTEMDSISDGGYHGLSQEERVARAKGETMAIRISNLANLVLFIAKVYVSVRSKSLAIIASTLDSLLDLLSGFILWLTAFSMQRPDRHLYPIGKKRMQPVGILVFAVVMAMLGVQILVEAAQQLISQNTAMSLSGDTWPWVIGVMVGVTFVKLALMVYCRMFENEIVRAYALDHFFDVVTNSIGLLAAVLASKTNKWWMDPAGAVLLALYTTRTWGLTVWENVTSLVGKTAPPEFLQKLTYLCWNHHKDILQIDTVRAYTFGAHYFAEVDIVLPDDMPLKRAHDIGEALQNKLESLPDIERAFVHLDYEVTHKPEHGIEK